MCDMPTGAVCVNRNCNECVRRLREGPHYDPARRTGRTTAKIRMALLAAMMGRRVLFVAHTQHYGHDCAALAVDMLNESEQIPGMPKLEVSYTKDTITFYLNGKEHGVLRFESMGADLERYNRGIKEPLLYRMVYDHHALELIAERERQEQRLADSNEIKRLMRKNGWHEAQDILGQQNVGRKCDQNKLVFRT